MDPSLCTPVSIRVRGASHRVQGRPVLGRELARGKLGGAADMLYNARDT